MECQLSSLYSSSLVEKINIRVHTLLLYFGGVFFLASNSKSARQGQDKKINKLNTSIVVIPLLALLIKIIVLTNIPSGGWLGSDGISWLQGADGLIKQGYFSDVSVLSYMPSGYPILIWLIAKFSLVNAVWLLSFFQSAFYAYASYYFVKQLSHTRLQPYIFLISLVIAFNPTLSLSTLVVGYESLLSSCMLMIAGIIIMSKRIDCNRKFLFCILGVGAFSALASFIQPRWILTSTIITIVWALMYKSRKVQVAILAGVIGVMAIAPAVTVQRNIQSVGQAVIATILGSNMAHGAGDETSGGYGRTGPTVPCEPIAPKTVVSDSDLVKCVIKWYVTHPVKAVRLFINKGFYFWSPWYGPLGNGTMARNPWLKINPIVNIATSSTEGYTLVTNSVSKVISFVWMLSCISLMFIGFFWLRSMKDIYRHIAYVTIAPIVVSWLVAMGTVGDHRYRIPTMPLSLFLQVMGYFALRHKIKTRSFATTEAKSQDAL